MTSPPPGSPASTGPDTVPTGPTRSILCLACRAIFVPTTPKNDSGEVAHHGLEALGTRASRGCHLCLTVYMSIDPDALAKFRKMGGETEGFAWISPTARDQARLKFRFVRSISRLTGSTMPGSTTSSQRGTVASAFAFPFSGPIDPLDRSGGGSVGVGVDGSGALVVELHLVKPEYAVEPGVKILDESCGHTGSVESLESARSWLQECNFNHMKCSVAEPNQIWKPTHLLDVSIKGPKGAPGVKLVDGMFLDPLAEYVTLSHSWGNKGKPIRLHKKTLPALRQGIANSSLPKTFAEAAKATALLGFRYLWIDALCIMHDSETAVLREISQMHKVYSEASLNIAATSAKDDSAGLFHSRNVTALQPCVVELTGVGVDDGMYKCLRSTIWHDLVDSSPLVKRAWVFQERCLAKRTLHFTRNELLWECQQMCCSEVFPRGLPATGLDSDDMFSKRYHHQKKGNWHNILKFYSRGKLSYDTDKLLAIAGLARQYMVRNRLREVDYVAGLWRSQMPHALLWRIESGRGSVKYRAPSWSWASLDGVVTYPENSQMSRETCVEVLDIQIKTKQGVLGTVEQGSSIKVRGFLIKGTLRRTHDYWGPTPCTIKGPKSAIDIESICFDERLPKLSSGGGTLTEQLEVYCLPIIDTADTVEGLLLCATMKKKGEFRRLGAFAMSRSYTVAWDRFKENMKGDAKLLNYESRLDHPNEYWYASDYTYTINIV